MAKIHFTDKAIKSLRTNKPTEDFWDTTFPAFAVRVSSSGTKSFFLSYRNNQKERKRYILGKYPETTLSDAREAAKALLIEISKGEDPSQKKLEYKSAETINELCKDYLELHAKVHKKEKSVRDDTYTINKDILPTIGKMKCCDVKRKDILRILDHIAIERNAPIKANRTRALLSKIFNFAVERAVIENNPCTNIPKHAKETSRDRFLSKDEIRTLFTTLQNQPDDNKILCNLLLLILLTGQRPGECSGMKWSEIKNHEWTIPKERSKNGNANIVFLHSWVLEILNEQKTINEKMKLLATKNNKDTARFDEYIFNTKFKSGFTWNNRAVKRIALQTKLKDWTAHDLRRTCATHLEENEFSSDCIDRIQNHVKAGITGTYQRGHRKKEVERALTWWGDYLKSIWNGQEYKGKVINLR